MGQGKEKLKGLELGKVFIQPDSLEALELLTLRQLLGFVPTSRPCLEEERDIGFVSA